MVPTSRLRGSGPAALAALLTVASCRPADTAPTISELLVLDSVAHLAGDAAALASLVGDSLVSVWGGEVTVTARDDVRRNFEAYFGSVDIVVWDEERAPAIVRSPSGSTVTVSRAVRQERDVAVVGGGLRRDTIRLAWTATFERSDGRWYMTTVATTEAEPEPTVAHVLAAARAAVGRSGPGSPGADALRVEASVRWAGPTYQVALVSAPDGRVRLDFVGDVSLGVGADARWSKAAGAEPLALSDTMETFLRGHDFFLNLVEPGPRVGGLRVAGFSRFEGRDATLVTGTDVLGGVVRLYYGRDDGLPLGYEVEDHGRGGPTVRTSIRGWSEQGSVRTPSAVRFQQAEEVFDYTVTAFEALPSAPDSLFGPPGADRG